MLSFRQFRANELPWILQCATETALAQLVSRDLPDAGAATAARQMQAMYDRTLQTPGGTILVADWPDVSGATPAAYALLMPQPNGFTGATELIVMDIWTDPRLRGRRVGRMMLDQAEQYARSAGCNSLTAQVALHNQSSLQMFFGSGYQPERVIVGKRP